jgi:hypothetical protein
MTDNELISYLSKGGSLCGRFKQSQLKTYQVEKWNLLRFLKIPAPLIVLMTMLLSRPAQAQTPTPPATEQRFDSKAEVTPVATVSSTNVHVRGVVVDESGERMPGVNVVRKGSRKSTVTNAEGEFEISVRQGSILVVSVIGCKSKEVRVDDDGVLNITLDWELTALGGVEYRPGLWARIMNIFR